MSLDGSCEHFKEFFREEIEENTKKDWTVVAKIAKTNNYGYFTLSALIQQSKESLQQILSTVKWEIQNNFGIPEICMSPDGNFYYNENNKIETEFGNFQPFTIWLELDDIDCFSNIVLIQDFILRYRAFFKQKENILEYQFVDDEGVTQELAKIICDYNKDSEHNNITVLVNTHYLRKYLREKRCFLIRYHDHRKKMGENNGEETHKPKFPQQEGKYIFVCKKVNKVSKSVVLQGKDVIPPYKEGIEEKRYKEFIIGRDEEGNEIRCSCNPEENNGENYLTPVFFKREVLQEYYNNSDKYTVDDISVKCLNKWEIPILNPNEKLIQVYLGDLGRIPYREQEHWAKYNVISNEGIDEVHYKQDFLAEFIESKDIIAKFKKAYDKIQKTTKKVYGKPLFLPLEKGDKYLVKKLHIPYDNEGDFDNQIIALQKITVDSLNVELLREIIIKKSNITQEELEGWRSIKLLERYLDVLGFSQAKIQEIIEPFKKIQKLRSLGAAHRKSKSYESYLKKYNISDSSKEDIGKDIIEKLTQSLEILEVAINNRVKTE